MIFFLDNSFNGRKLMKITAAVARTVFATGSVRRTPVLCYGVGLGWLVPGITLKLAGNRRHKSVKVYIVGQKIEIFGRLFFKNLFSFHHIGAK